MRIKEDYFIVYGINKDELSGRKFLYRYSTSIGLVQYQYQCGKIILV